MEISIIEVKENLTKYGEMVQRGVEVTISVNDVLACKIVGTHQPTRKTVGLVRGRAAIPDDFDHHDRSILGMFYGGDDR